MKSLRLAALPLILSAACSAHAQTAEIEVNDGTNATCYRSQGSAPCGFFTVPTIDTFVSDGAARSSEITTTSTATTVRTQNGGTWSGLNVIGEGTALESSATTGHAIAATQTGISSLTGLEGGQFAATGENASNQDSTLVLEGTQSFMRTRDTSASTLSFYETGLTGTMMGYSENGEPVATISSNAVGHQIVGDTSLSGTLSATGLSTLSGIDNQGAGIANAGRVSGVANGDVSAQSTDAINGSQLSTTNVNVAAARATGDTALADAATAQTTANAALANAAAAQATGDTAMAHAATARTTADAALANAVTAQVTADKGVADAATAQTAADAATARANTAQTTANDAHALASTARASAATAMTNSADAINMANTANTNALSAYSMASGLSGRISSLEGRVEELRTDLDHVDEMAGRGIAIATALASMPDLEPGKRMGLGIGTGTYDGHNAVSAAFIVRANDSAKFRVNAGTAGDGKFAFGAGGMFSW